jgi:hypothetical protein
MSWYKQGQEYRIQPPGVIPFSMLNSVFFMLYILFQLLFPGELLYVDRFIDALNKYKQSLKDRMDE